MTLVTRQMAAIFHRSSAVTRLRRQASRSASTAMLVPDLLQSPLCHERVEHPPQDAVCLRVPRPKGPDPSDDPNQLVAFFGGHDESYKSSEVIDMY